jgi:hypothetical protein
LLAETLPRRILPGREEVLALRHLPSTHGLPWRTAGNDRPKSLQCMSMMGVQCMSMIGPRACAHTSQARSIYRDQSIEHHATAAGKLPHL